MAARDDYVMAYLRGCNAIHSADLSLDSGSIFANPMGLAIGPTKRILFLSDTQNNRVFRYDNVDSLPGSSQANIVFGQSDFVGVLANRGLVPAANTLSNPTGLFYDEVNDRL